jgi:hypothetical protein
VSSLPHALRAALVGFDVRSSLRAPHGRSLALSALSLYQVSDREYSLRLDNLHVAFRTLQNYVLVTSAEHAASAAKHVTHAATTTTATAAATAASTSTTTVTKATLGTDTATDAATVDVT